MIDRQKLETILQRRFPGAPLEQVAAAANAIMTLDDEGHESCRKTGTTSGSRRKSAEMATASNLPLAPP